MTAQKFYPSTQFDMTGVLPVYKPSSQSSKDVSRFLTRLFGKHKLGHVGTLDPLAEGVLPILFGRATRLQDYLQNFDKTYICHLRLGSSTDTLDAHGKQTACMPFAHISREMVLERAKDFVGEITQKPPIYSAIKFQGVPLYKYARQEKGHEVDLEKHLRRVHVYELRVLGFSSGKIIFEARVSKGTYIRTLAHDLALALGTLGHVEKLIRTKSSGFDVSQTLSLGDLQNLSDQGLSLASSLIPIALAPLKLQCMIISSKDFFQKIYTGQKVFLDPQLSSEFFLHNEHIHLSSIDCFEVLLNNSDGHAVCIAELKKASSGQRYMKIKRSLL